MNCVNLIGRLTKDLELRQSQSGSASCRFTLAVDRIQRSDQQKETDFINCVAFGKTAENLCRYMHKGSQMAVTGSIQTGSYEKDGQKVFTTDILVGSVESFSRKKKMALRRALRGQIRDIRRNSQRTASLISQIQAIRRRRRPDISPMDRHHKPPSRRPRSTNTTTTSTTARGI